MDTPTTIPHELGNIQRPTKEQADALVALPKVITAPVEWRPDGAGWRLEAKAVAPQGRLAFRVTAYIGKRNHSFALLFNNYPIRKYTKHAPHRIGDRLFTEPHKHTWDTELGDRAHAYIPPDIDPQADINAQFLAFCRECNIRIEGSYRPIIDYRSKNNDQPLRHPT